MTIGLRLGAFCILAGGCLPAQDARTPQAALGKIMPKLVCAQNPAQDYALYLPSNYDPTRPWPIIYAFDAGARGSLPLELGHAAAEKFGYIMVGSNQSSNFDPKAQSDAVRCLWEDTHQRFHIDDTRIYVSGFSGGSRLAAKLAENCALRRCIAGVIAHGAGFPTAKPPKEAVPFAYFATVGDLDFNHPEMIELRNGLEERGVANRLIVFPGPHQWGPAETWLEALAWLDLQAMKRGALPRDEIFIRAQLAVAQERARKGEESGDLYSAWRENAGIARDFAGLADITAYAQKAEALRSAKAIRDGAKRERDQANRQYAISANLRQLYGQLSLDDGSNPRIAQQLTTQVTDLRNQAAKQKDPTAKAIAQRALSEVTVMLFEGAQADRLEKRWLKAALKTEVACASVEKPTRGLVQAAKDYARAGDTRATLRDLRRAVENGFSNRSDLENAEEFGSLRQSEPFMKILEMMPVVK